MRNLIRVSRRIKYTVFNHTYFENLLEFFQCHPVFFPKLELVKVLGLRVIDEIVDGLGYRVSVKTRRKYDWAYVTKNKGALNHK